jgi:hypothetical protein
MTIQFEYVEKSVIHVRWIDKVTIEEIESEIRNVCAMIDQKGDLAYVEILDLQECKMIPFDVRGLRRVGTHDPRIVGYVILKPTVTAKSMMQIITQVARLALRTADSMDAALDVARSMLNEHSRTKT